MLAVNPGFWAVTQNATNIMRKKLSIFTLFYLDGLIFESKKAKETGRLGIEAFLFSGIISQTGKIIFGRARPYCEEGAKKFYGPDFTHNSRHSLPSGHATVAFSFASVIAHQYPELWVGFTVYSIAGTVGISRIYEICSNERNYMDLM